MNSLLLTKERIKSLKAYQTQLSTTQKGMLIIYRRYTFEERKKLAYKDLALIES